VRRRIEHAGIAATTARRAVDEVFSGIDDHALIEAALARRLRDHTAIVDDREFRRLYRYLIAQGFDAESVMKTLTAHRRQS
jgi:SOS response regulatory protein OraA/RecX